MKKIFLEVVLMIFSVLLIHVNVFADDQKTDVPDIIFSGAWDRGIITTADIYCLGQEYENGNLSAEDSYFEFLDKRAVDFWGSDEKMDAYIVKGEDGNDDYLCTLGFYDSSYISGYPCLESKLTRERIEIDGDMEALETYMQKNNEVKELISRKAAYIKENLDNSQHGGYYYCLEDGRIHIFLTDISKKAELEAEGIVCEEAEYSCSQMYEKMKELWENREKWGICHILLNNHENNLTVTTKTKELQDMFTDDDSMIYLDNAGNVISIEYILGEENTAALQESLEFINFYQDDEQYEKLNIALESLKEAYPEYDYINLYQRIVRDLDYEKYLDFSEELCEYVAQLPAYQAEENLIDEIIYGDPLRLELKRMLREYKEEYPDMSYQNIYEIYIKDIEENKKFSNREKFYWYLWDKYTRVFEDSNSADKLTGRVDIIVSAVFGGIVLILGGVGVCVKKRNCK